MAARNDGGGAGRKGDKIWRDAINAALRQDPNKIKRLAERLLDECEAGNMQAIKELGDRLDGKPTQQVDVGNIEGETLTIETLVHLAPDEAYKKLLG